MRHVFDKQPEFVRQILLTTTPCDEWAIYINACIVDKESEMAGLSTDCTANQFQRKYMALKAEKQQFHDWLDLLEYFKTERTT